MSPHFKYSDLVTEGECAALAAYVRSLKKNLFRKEELEYMGGYRHLTELIDHLMATHYENFLSEAFEHQQGVLGVESGINMVFCRRLQKVLRYMQLEEPPTCSLVRNEWDFHNTKALVRHILNKSEPEIAKLSCIPIGRYTQEIFDKALEGGSLLDFIDFVQKFNLPYAELLQRVALQYSTKEDMAKLEWEIESSFYQHYRKWLNLYQAHEGGLVIRNIFALTIDIANLRTVLRFMPHQLKSEQINTLFVLGGNLQYERFELLLEARSIDEIIARLSDHYLVPALEKGMLHYMSTNDISVFERFFEERDILFKRKMATCYPISIAMVLYYITLAKNEMINLRIIARGLSCGLPRGKMIEELIYV